MEGKAACRAHLLQELFIRFSNDPKIAKVETNSMCYFKEIQFNPEQNLGRRTYMHISYNSA